MTIREIGCCGAYCRTCMEQQKQKYPNERTCLGCKLGYESGKRDLSKAKCEIKVCCFREKQLEYLKQNGYVVFLRNADAWKGPHGKLKAP